MVNFQNLSLLPDGLTVPDNRLKEQEYARQESHAIGRHVGIHQPVAVQPVGPEDEQPHPESRVGDGLLAGRGGPKML